MQLTMPYLKFPNVNQIIHPKIIAPKIEAVIGAPCCGGCWQVVGLIFSPFFLSMCILLSLSTIPLSTYTKSFPCA